MTEVEYMTTEVVVQIREVKESWFERLLSSIVSAVTMAFNGIAAVAGAVVAVSEALCCFGAAGACCGI